MTDDFERPTAEASDVLQQVHSELRGAADDLRRLTERLREQTAVVERLDSLLSEAFDLIPAPAIVVDAEGKLAATSRGAREAYPAMRDGALGEPVAEVLPDDLCRDIMAVASSTSMSGAHRSTRADLREPLDPGEAQRWVPARGGKVAALPRGWAFALLNP